MSDSHPLIGIARMRSSEAFEVIANLNNTGTVQVRPRGRALTMALSNKRKLEGGQTLIHLCQANGSGHSACPSLNQRWQRVDPAGKALANSMRDEFTWAFYNPAVIRRPCQIRLIILHISVLRERSGGSNDQEKYTDKLHDPSPYQRPLRTITQIIAHFKHRLKIYSWKCCIIRPTPSKGMVVPEPVENACGNRGDND
ncbi:hypothetical protein ACK9YZ_06815 [Rhizobium sp. ZK1]|uniref:hypothetical protein n=1 Tax=Rhizobium sp. ZK1 TaxID=3389872 RepID=UPI0039F6AC21